MKLKAIAVVDNKWGIGKDGGLLIHLSNDLKFFKEKTLNNIVIMGRATLESLPGAKPLPNRTTIIMTSDKELKGDFCTVSSIDELFELLKDLLAANPDKEVFVAGGESIYKQLLPYTDTFIITKIDADLEAENFFSNLDEAEDIQMVNSGDSNFENGVDYTFTEYKRINR